MSGYTDFRAALLDPNKPPPAGLMDGQARPASKRYDVYRNNVTHTLLEAMNVAFPFVRKLLGAQKFTSAALQYVRTHPPKSPIMMFYGADFAAFLTQFDPVIEYGYLPDAARLDLAMREAYHAADAPALTPEKLQAMPQEDLATAPFNLLPSSRILRSDWPLFDIWRFTMEPDSPKPREGAQDVLITRPEFDPQVHLSPPGTADWLLALEAGTSFDMACETALHKVPAFDLTQSLTLALSTSVFQDPTTRN